jgi:TolB-like protein
MIFSLGPFRLDTQDGLLLLGREPVALGRRAIALLRALVEQPGALLSKDALIEAGWPGQFVEESNLTVQIAALRRVLGKTPGGAGWIETMPGRGYRFVGPVVAEAQKGAPEKCAAPRLSMVVLPFANFGGDLEQEHFVDGVTESLTTDLSRIRGAVVIARNTAFTYKNKPLDAKQIGRELNVRYVLEGSVQRGADRMRVNVQLIDAETSSHLWAERFDKPLADLFEMQDEIVARLANALNAQLTAAEARRAEQAPTPDSIDLYFQGLAWLNKGRTPQTIAQARSFFDRALTADPHNVEALIEAARADGYSATLFLVSDPAATLASANAKLTKALSLAPDHPRGHMWLGYIEIFTKHAARGITECEHALTLDRNLAGAHAIIGMGKIYVGRPDETETHILEALRLSPRDTLAYTWMSYVAVAKRALGSYEEALTWCRRSIEANRNHPTAWIQLTAALAQLGRRDEARFAAQAVLEVSPAFTLSRARAAWMTLSDDPTFLVRAEQTLKGLREAGIPEQ